MMSHSEELTGWGVVLYPARSVFSGHRKDLSFHPRLDQLTAVVKRQSDPCCPLCFSSHCCRSL